MTSPRPPRTVEDYRRGARELLPREMWEALIGEREDEGWATETNNLDGFLATKLRPRVLVDTSERRLGTTALGTEIGLPVMIDPSGSHQRWHADGELATARAAGRVGTIMALSTASTYSIEEVAAVATGPLWFQLYFMRDRRVTERLVRRAEEAGYRAIVLTVDNAGVASRERDADFSTTRGSYDLTKEHAVSPFFDPARSLRNYHDLGIEGVGPLERSQWQKEFEPGLSWSHVEWLRSLTELPLVIKGIQAGEDGRLCAENGIDGLVVSNHGGFVLPNGRATIEVLPEVVAEAGAVEVYLDGGVRRGTDVLKALALGARAVLVGRAQIWGLTVGGEDGIVDVLRIIRDELDDAMRFCGVADVTRVDPALVVPAPGARGDVVDRLERLAALHDRGLLSPVDLDRAKQRVLDGQ
jgi:4-hydroxymandelate oxidase